eukprot:1308891-Pleurochrysis_carterae.AAC.1
MPNLFPPFTGSLLHIPSVPSRQCVPESSLFSRPPSFSRTAFLQQSCFHSPSAHWHFQYCIAICRNP